MPPNSNFVLPTPPSTLGINHPPRRGPTVNLWLEDKREADNAEGLWRIHDNLYDLSSFVKDHPGGSDWLEISKGLDITEAFEVHHVKRLPEDLLQKFFVRRASSKRNAPFTFKEDGFYKTLKREVQKELPKINRQPKDTSRFFTDAFTVFMLFFSVLALKYWDFFVGALAGLFMGLMVVAAHNYVHKRDNWRMYLLNFSFMTVRGFRVSHIISHHLHTNTIDDLELIMHEPLLYYLPTEKSQLRKLVHVAVIPVYWASGFHRSLIQNVVDFVKGKTEHQKLSDLIPFILPIFMYFTTDRTVLETFVMWNYILMVGSTSFYTIGQHAAHHHPDVFHDGDEPRCTEDYDWGISQLDAVMERTETTGSHFLVLTTFGDHCLHHLFPTLDHGVLEHLYPVFKKTMEQFDVNLRMVSNYEIYAGGFQQLIRDKPNRSPPDLHKYKLKMP